MLHSSIHDALLSIKAQALSGRNFYTGLCYETVHSTTVRSDRVEKWLKTQFKQWPEWSGDRDYPVPAGAMHPINAYNKAADNDSMLSRTTRYGRNRWKLLNFLIRQAKAQNV